MTVPMLRQKVPRLLNLYDTCIIGSQDSTRITDKNTRITERQVFLFFVLWIFAYFAL